MVECKLPRAGEGADSPGAMQGPARWAGEEVGQEGEEKGGARAPEREGAQSVDWEGRGDVDACGSGAGSRYFPLLSGGSTGSRVDTEARRVEISLECWCSSLRRRLQVS